LTQKDILTFIYHLIEVTKASILIVTSTLYKYTGHSQLTLIPMILII